MRNDVLRRSMRTDPSRTFPRGGCLGGPPPRDSVSRYRVGVLERDAENWQKGSKIGGLSDKRTETINFSYLHALFGLRYDLRCCKYQSKLFTHEVVWTHEKVMLRAFK